MELNSKKHALVLLFGSLFLAIIYKFWKFFVAQNLASPEAEYTLYEIYNTFFRVLNSGLAFALCVWAYKSFKSTLFSISKKQAAVLTAYVSSYFLMRYYFFDLEFRPNIFLVELFINSFAGISEELLFRAGITVSLLSYMRVDKAALAASAIFSLWHFDVSTDPLYFANWFLAGLVYSYAFLSGIGLLPLMIVHFIWNQITYGFIWAGYATNDYMLLLSFIGLVFLLYFRKKLTYETHKNPDPSPGI